jgi:hypothetical protein
MSNCGWQEEEGKKEKTRKKDDKANARLFLCILSFSVVIPSVPLLCQYNTTSSRSSHFVVVRYVAQTMHEL